MLRRIKYIRRLLSKLSSFAVFGISSLILGTSLFPLFHVLAGFSEKRFNVISRRFVNLFFRFFVKYIEVTGAMRLSVENRELLKGIKGKVVIANHPSLLDVVILFSSREHWSRTRSFRQSSGTSTFRTASPSKNSWNAPRSR